VSLAAAAGSILFLRPDSFKLNGETNAGDDGGLGTPRWNQ